MQKPTASFSAKSSITGQREKNKENQPLREHPSIVFAIVSSISAALTFREESYLTTSPPLWCWPGDHHLEGHLAPNATAHADRRVWTKMLWVLLMLWVLPLLLGWSRRQRLLSTSGTLR